MTKRSRLPLAFLLGCLLTLAATELPSRLRFGTPGEAGLTLVIPALAAETYTYRETRGFTAVLRAQGGQQLELPAAWLPGESRSGATFRVHTQVRPGDAVTTFGTTIAPAK